MRLPGSKGQFGTRDLTFRADGSTNSDNTKPKLILPEGIQRSYVSFQNISVQPMYLEFGSARATASLTGTGVSSCSITNGGFGFTRPPLVSFLGGGYAQGQGSAPNTAFIPYGDPYFPSPDHPAQGRCVLTAGVVTSIVIDDPGIGYIAAPYVRITNDPLDLVGCADPSLNSGTGLLLYPAQSLYDAHISVPTDQMAVFCATASQAYFCRYF